MSGGYYDIPIWKLDDMANDIEEYINGEEVDKEDLEFMEQNRWVDKEAIEYIKKHGRTEPNDKGFSKETIKLMKQAVKAIKIARVYINRVDYLMEGDDSEESFQRRVKEDLEKLKNNKK